MTITRLLVLLFIFGLVASADAQLAGLTLERSAGQAPAAVRESMARSTRRSTGRSSRSAASSRSTRTSARR